MNTFLQAGFAEIDLTPDSPVRLAGQFAETHLGFRRESVTATALAIETGGEQAVICSCDLVSILELQSAIRVRLRGETGPGSGPGILCATHTHTSLLYQVAASNRSLAVLQRYAADTHISSTCATTLPSCVAPAAFDWLARRIASDCDGLGTANRRA